MSEFSNILIQQKAPISRQGFYQNEVLILSIHHHAHGLALLTIGQLYQIQSTAQGLIKVDIGGQRPLYH